MLNDDDFPLNWIHCTRGDLDWRRPEEPEDLDTQNPWHGMQEGVERGKEKGCPETGHQVVANWSLDSHWNRSRPSSHLADAIWCNGDATDHRTADDWTNNLHEELTHHRLFFLLYFCFLIHFIFLLCLFPSSTLLSFFSHLTLLSRNSFNLSFENLFFSSLF